MYASNKNRKAISFGLTTAMAAVLLSGCTTGSAPRADLSASAPAQAMATGHHAEAISHAEAAVLSTPNNAGYRMTLGDAYLDGGRFASAEATFTDAMMLGDNSARAALSLALAQIAQEKYAEAATLLNDWDGEIAKADLGLALSLAGQPERGIHIMSNAIRGGENTVKMRQNLAYAFAMAGRWREARLMAQQDLPAGEVNARMEQWASLSSAGAYQHRVANLLQVPANVVDNGQPAQLALANTSGAEQLAYAAPTAPTVIAPPTPAYVPNTELAAISSQPAPAVRANLQEAVVEAALVETLVMPAPSARSAAPLAAPASAVAPTSDFVAAFSAPNSATPTSAAPISSNSASAQYAVTPALAPQRSVAAASARESTHFVNAPAVAQAAFAEPARAAARQPASMASGGDSHLIQLGSFSSEAGAQRAWTIYLARFPELANHERVITQAVVRGKRYWRVSAGGFDNGSSRAMCGQVSSASSDGCISWAAAAPLPGAINTPVQFARR